MAEKKAKTAKPKKKSRYGEDSKGRNVIINGKKCHTEEEAKKELYKLNFY